jgi:ABC-type transporter Mla maintaining outer membrane lipid asymmetry ATPase subunit MlaF
MVLREGRLVFEGDQDRLESTADEYISKFCKHRE